MPSKTPPPRLTDAEQIEIALAYQAKMREQFPRYMVWLDLGRLSGQPERYMPRVPVSWREAIIAIEWRGLVVLPPATVPAPVEKKTLRPWPRRKRS